MSQANRKKQWESKRIFFLTPQIFNNDLARGNVKPENIKCIVFDEAHKALGNQAYCQIIRSIKPFNSQFRVLALSATPGDQMNMVEQVIMIQSYNFIVYVSKFFEIFLKSLLPIHFYSNLHRLLRIC